MSQKQNPETDAYIIDLQSQIQILEAEKERLSHSLEEAKNLNDAFFKYNPTELIVVDREGRITEFSQAKAESGSRIPNIGEVMYRDYAAKHSIDMYSELIDTIQNGVAKSFPERQYDNQYLAIAMSPFPNGAVISSRDITVQKRAEMALIKSEKEKDLILSSVSEVVIYQDRNYQIRWANPAAAQSLKMQSNFLIGKTCYNVWHHRETPCEGCPMFRIFEDGQPYREETHMPDGRSWDRRGYPVREENGEVNGLVMVWHDITKQKEAEAEKERIQSQLIQAQKMEAIGRLAGGVAHDFNNLLTAILGGLDMTLMKFDPKESIYDELQEIFQAANRASELTRQLLLFSREHLPQFETVSLNDTIQNLLKMLHRLIGEDVTIITSLAPELMNVRVDKGTIEQVIMNLAVNARDAMPRGGQLTLRTENLVIDEKEAARIPDARPGDFVRLSVKDTGLGISSEIISRIFEPFFTTKKVGKGTGLGLSVVYGIMKQQRGWISVQSQEGHGTTFDIYLPAVTGRVSESSKEIIDMDVPRGNGERILIVEDEKIVRDFAIRALKKNGYEIFSAASGVEAIEIFEKEQGRFDLVFSDVVLPDMNGIELIDQFLSRDQNLQILISSGYTDTKSQWRVIRDKGYRFLQKPYVLNDLYKAIRTAIDRT